MPSNLRPARRLAFVCLPLLLSACGTTDDSSPITSRPTEPSAAASPSPAVSLSAPTATADLPSDATGTSAPMPVTSFGGGIQIVGTDVQPGTYQSSSDPSGGGELGGIDACYWERLAGLSGDLRDIIANDLTEGRATVTIAPGDVAFSSFGCGTWTEVP